MPADRSQVVECNALRLPSVSENAPLREVVETISYDDTMRVERLACGHIKTTLTAQDRPAKRRRCWKCWAMADLTPERIEEARQRAEILRKHPHLAEAGHVRLLAADFLALLSESSEREKALRALLLECHGWMNGVYPKPAQPFLDSVLDAALAGSPSEKPNG